jgi:hypothetical protein
MSEAFLDRSPLNIILLSGIIQRIRKPSHRGGSPLREQSFQTQFELGFLLQVEFVDLPDRNEQTCGRWNGGVCNTFSNSRSSLKKKAAL